MLGVHARRMILQNDTIAKFRVRGCRRGKHVGFAAPLQHPPVFIVCFTLMEPKNPPSKPDGADLFASPGSPTDPIPFRQDARTGTLPSGLRYFILENSMPENRAHLRLIVNAGCLHEEDQEQGLAHFVEHMAFDGTERFAGKGTIDEYLRSLGMPPSNAFTSLKKTVYYFDIPVEIDGKTGIRVIPPTALAIIDDWTRSVAFDPKALETERLVIIEEHRMYLGAEERISWKWRPVLFRGSRLAERTPIGLPEVIKATTPAQLETFYRKWYQADNMTLVFVGDFDGAALEASLPGHFLIEKPAAPTPQPRFDLPPPRSGNLETLVLTDPELTATEVKLYFRRGRKPLLYDLAYLLEETIDYLISNMMYHRFGDAMPKPETPYISVETDFMDSGLTAQLGMPPRFYVMSAVAKSGLARETLAELLNAVQSIKRHGFTDEEIALSSEAVISDRQGLAREWDKQESVMLASLVDYHTGISGMRDIEWEMNAIRHFLSGIGTKQINAAARNYFADDDLRIFIFAPESEKETLPNDAQIRLLAADHGMASTGQPKTRTMENRLLSKTPERGAIVSHSVDEGTGADLWELGNGTRVVLKSTHNMNDEIAMKAMALGGTFCAPLKEDVSADLASAMIEASGLGPWSRPDLQRLLASRQVSFSRWIDSYTRGFQGISTVEDLAVLFEQIHLSFVDPRIDPDAARAVLDNYRTELSLRGEDPATIFSDEIDRALYGDHPRHMPTKPSDLDRVDIDTALAFLRRGLNPADFTFVFTGNLTPDLMRPYVETYLASLPRKKESWNTWTDIGIPRPGGIERNIRRGREEQGIVYMGWFAPAVHSEEQFIVSQALDKYLHIRLNDEIRGNLGGVYGIDADISSTWPKEDLALQVQFTCDPQRVGELSQAVCDLLNETAAGIIDGVFAGVLETMHKEWEVSMQSNSLIALSYVNSKVVLDLPMSRLHRRAEYIATVTPADIQDMAARLLREKPVKVVLLPEEKP